MHPSMVKCNLKHLQEARRVGYQFGEDWCKKIKAVIVYATQRD